MNRRGFFGLLGGAAVSAPSMARAAAGDSMLRQAGFASGSGVLAAAPTEIVPATPGMIAKAARWIKRHGIPSWKMYEITRAAEYQRSNGLDPDIAVLVSVSAGWKARTQRKRNLDRAIETSLAGMGRNSARNAFEAKMQKQFGTYLEWYD